MKKLIEICRELISSESNEGCSEDLTVVSKEYIDKLEEQLYIEEKQKLDNKIIIDVDGGLIQDIHNIPDGVEIEVRDYDTDGETSEDGDEDIFEDDNGYSYFLGVWKNSD